MEENVRENKMGRNIAIIIVVIVLLTVVYLLFGLKRYMDANITEDKQAVYAGSQPGAFQVSVMATGSNHESREAQIYVTVEE